MLPKVSVSVLTQFSDFLFIKNTSHQMQQIKSFSLKVCLLNFRLLSSPLKYVCKYTTISYAQIIFCLVLLAKGLTIRILQFG